VALTRKWIASPNFTSGNNGRRLLVLHTSEGAQTWQSLGNFFANSSSQVSSHVGIDDQRGTIGEYVKRGNSAWTASGANMVAVQAELCTPSGAAANWTRDTWMNKHHNMLLNVGDWLREESKATGIPLVKLTPSQAQGNGRGVCQHKDLGAWGGGHVDCGPGFPIDYVIDLAKGTAPPSQPSFVEDEPEMFYAQFLDNRSPIVIPNQYSDGKGRIRLGSNGETVIRIDWPNSANVDLTLNYSNGAQGVTIPEGTKYAVLRRQDTSTALVAVCFSK